MEKIYLTREGYDKLKNELEMLKKRRPDLSRAIGEAREQGDISENAEYDAAKEEQGLNEMKIADLENKLGRAQLIDPKKIPKDEVVIGTTVTLEDINTKETTVYTLVSELESDFSKGKISINSPVGRGLMNHKLDEVIEIKVPAGLLKYKIKKMAVN
ncbi:MAG: transcription elongation factor GreA [bacterium]